MLANGLAIMNNIVGTMDVFRTSHFPHGVIERLSFVGKSVLFWSVLNQRFHCIYVSPMHYNTLQDIVDTGATMKKLLSLLAKFEPTSVKVARYTL